MKTNSVPLIAFMMTLSILFSVVSCKTGNSNAKTDASDDITLTGVYQSVRGVMTDLSCYCYNCGTLKTENGESFNISFDAYDKAHGETNIDCQKITVTGKMTTVTVENNPNNPCPAGSNEVFVVTGFKCEE